MITSIANLASILLCMIVVSSTTPSSHHGTLSTPQKYYDSPINEQAADKDKNEEIACISPDTNIYEIFHKAEKEARGVDMKCHFYLHNKEKSEYIGTLDVNKELFDKLLGKYNHWLLTKLDTNSNGVKDARDKIDNRLSDNAEGADDNKNNHHSTHHHKPHHTKDNHHIKEIDDKKFKKKHYIELDPRYNETHRYFEVFLPKEKHKNDPRTIYINVDEDNKEFQLYENEKHREMNYKPIKIGLRELSAIADVIFSKAEAGKNVFTVNDENSEDSEKYEIRNVDYETVSKEEDAKDGNSFDLDPNTILANDSDISSNENDTVEHGYTELNGTNIDKNDKIETDKANSDTKPYIDDNTVENNETEPYSDFDGLHTDTNKDFDNDKLTKIEDNENTDKATKMDNNTEKSYEEIHELPSRDTEDQENVVPIDLTRSQLEENILRTEESYAPVAECNQRFGNIFNNHIVPLNPSSTSNIQPHSEALCPLCNTLDISNNIPSNSNFDSCMKPNVLLPNCNNCNSVKIPYNSPLEELVTPNDLSQNSGSVFSPEQNLYAFPNEPCLVPLCNTMNMPNQYDKNFNNVPPNVLNYNPKFQPAILHQPNQIPPDNNANFLASTATVPMQNGVLNSLPNFNMCNSLNYNPFLQNPFSQSLPCLSPKEPNKNVLLNSHSYPFATRPISLLNYPWIKPNFLPNILSYPQFQNQNRPCLPFSNKGQIPLKSPSNTGLNQPLHSICIPNEVTESAKKYSPFNIHLSPNEDLTIDPTKFGYMTAMPFTKNPNNPIKSRVPSFKISGNNNQVFDSAEHSRLHNALTRPDLPSTSSFEDVNRNYVDKSTMSSSAGQSNLDSLLTGPQMNLNNSPFQSNPNNFNNVNVLSDKNLNSLLTSPQLNLNSSPFQSNSNNFNNNNLNSIHTSPQMNLNTLPFPSNANSYNNVKSLPDKNLNSMHTIPQMNLNTLPFASNANDFNNANVLSDTNLNSIHTSPQINLNTLPFASNGHDFNNANVLSDTNSNSIHTSPQFNLNSSPFSSNDNNLNNANVLSDTNLNSIHTSPQMNLNSSPYSSNGNNFNNVNVLSNNILDSSLTGPQLNLNSSPILSNSNNYNNANVLSDENLETLIKILSQSGYLVNSMGEKYLASPNALDLLNGLVEKKLSSPTTLDSTLIGSGLDLDASSNDLISDTLATSNTLSLPLDSTLTGPGLNNLIRPLDSTLIGSNISPSIFIPDTVASNVSSANSLQGLNTLDSSLVGPSLTLDKTGKLQPFEKSPISPNVGLNIQSNSYANSNVSPTDFNKDNTESIALPPLDSTLIGPKLGLPSLALDSSLIGPSLETLPSTPTLENRAPVNLIVQNDNNIGKDKIPELLENTLQSKVGIDEGEQLPQGGDASNIINVESPNSFDTKVTTPVIDKDFNLNIKETELPGKFNVDLVNEFPLVGDQPNTINVDSTKNTGTQIENPISIINTTESKLSNNLNNIVISPKTTDISQTEPDLNSKTGDLESYGNFDIVEPLNKESNLKETAIDSGLNGEINTSANEELSETSNTQKPEFNANLDDKTILDTKEHIKLIDVSNTTNYDAKLEENPEDTVVLYTTNINQTKNSKEIFNETDDTKNVLTQESRITIPNDEITVLDSSLLGSNLAMSKETPLSLIGGKVDSSSKGPGLFPKTIGIENIPDITVANKIDTSLTGDSPFQNNAIEINPKLNSNINLDSSLLGPGLNLDANTNLANGKEADKFNIVTDVNMANSLIEDRFLDHSLVGPTLPVDEHTPTFADKTLEYFDDANKLQLAILSILNSGNTIDSSLTGPDLLTLSKNAEDSLDIKDSPDFVTSRFTPVGLFDNKNDYNFNTAPIEYAPTTEGSPFVCTVPSIKPYASSTPMLPSFSSPSIPYNNILSSSFPSLTHSNLLPYTTNEYPPLFLPAPKPYESSILLNQNIPNMIPNTVSLNTLASICTYPIFTGNKLPSVSEPKPFVSLPTMPYSKPTSILNPFSLTFSSSSSLAPYQTFAIPPQPFLNDNSFTVSKPYTYSILPSNFVAPKLPEVTINPFSTQSLSGYLPKSFVPNSNALSSVSSTSPMFSSSIPSLVTSPTTFSSKPPFDFHTLNISPSSPDSKPLHYLPQSLSFLDQVHPNIQSIKLPSLPFQAPNTPKSSSDFQKPLYTSIINSLPAHHIKIPQELKYPSATSTSPIFFYTQMDLPTNKWAIPSSIIPVQNVATYSSMPMSMPPELPKISTQIPENKPCFQIPSNVPTNIPLSEWKFLIPNDYMPIISPPKVSMSSLKPECLTKQPNFDLSRNPHIPSTLPPNTATTSILNSIPLPTEFNLQSASPLSPSSSMNQIIPPLSSNLINYSQNLNNPLHFEQQLGTMPEEIVDKPNVIPNLQFKDAHNNVLIDKGTINEIECLLERDKPSRNFPHFDANVMSELKGPLYSVTQDNFEPYVVDGRTPMPMADSVPFAKPMLGANNLNPPFAIFNLAPVDFKPYTTDDKAPIFISSSVPCAEPSIGVNNLNVPNPMNSLTPDKYEPYTVNDKIPTPVSSPVCFTGPNIAAYTKSPYINSFMIPKPVPVITQNTLTSTVPTKSSVPHTNEYGFYTPVIETKLASLPPSNVESTSVPLSHTSSITNGYFSVPDHIESLRTDSLILPNTKLTSLSLTKSQTEPLITDTLPKVGSFKWSDIDLKGFKPYVEDTETNVAQPEDNNVPDERLVYSNDLFDRNHEEPFISETGELDYIEEEKDLLPYASPNRDAFGQPKSANTVSPSLRVNVPQNTFNNLPIKTITPCIKYETPITTLSSPLLKPLSLAPIPTYKKVNPFKTSPICKNVISPLLSSSPPSTISMTPSQYSPISTYPNIPTSSFSSPNIVSLPTTSNSYLPKSSSQLPPSSKSFLNSPVSLTNSLPDSLQYSAPIKPLAISINPTPSSAPNILETVPFISLSQIKEQPCTPCVSKPCVAVNKVPYGSPSATPCTILNSKPYVTVNKVAYPSPGVTPCSVSSLPCDNTLSSSPSVCQYPKLNSLPYIIPVTAAPTLLTSQPTPLPIVSTIPVPNLDHSAYTPNYATTTSPFTLNVTPFYKQPSLLLPQMPSNPIYNPSASSSLSSSPAVQTLDLPFNPYLPYSKMPSKSTPICLNLPSLPPCSTPCKINTDLNNNIKMLSPVEYQPFDIAYPATNAMSGIKTPLASSFVCPTETSPPLHLSNVLNPFINSIKPNPNPLTSTVLASPLISSHPSSWTFKLPCTTETPIPIPTKHFNLQNIPSLSNVPCINSLGSKTESLNYPPCIINTMPSKPLSSGLLENVQSIEIPSLPFTSPPLSSYNLIKVPSIKPSQSPCTQFNSPIYSPTNTLANPTSLPLFSTSTTVPKSYSPIFEPTIQPNKNYPPCKSFNIPANSPINPLTNTAINSPKSLPNSIDTVPKPYSSIFEPAISKKQYYPPCTLNVPPTSSSANSPINMIPATLKPISNIVLKPSLPIALKTYIPTLESTITSNKFYPSSTLVNAPESLSVTPTSINITPSSYSVPITTTVPETYKPIFEPNTTPIIQTLSPPQILPSTTSQSNTKPLYLTPKYMEPSTLYSTPNICSDSMKPPIVSSILSPSLSRPLFSNLLSPLADKPLISSPKQLPTNPPCNTIAPSHIHIPSLKSPYMQETATPSPTMYQPLRPVSSGVKSPMISPSLYQLPSPILSNSKSPVTSINLPHSQSYTTPSNFPITTAYNLPTPKSVQIPPFFLTPQNYRDLTQIPTPSFTSHSQPCEPPYKVTNPLTPVEFLVPKSRLQDNEDLMTLRDLNNLPNSLNGYKPFNIDEEMIKKDVKPEEQFDKTDLYTGKDSLYDITTEAFDYKTNEEHLEDNIHYKDNTPTYDTKYLIDNNYNIQEEPMKTIQNRDRINNIDLRNTPMEFNTPTLKSGPINKEENKTEFLEEPHHDTDDQIPEMSNKNPVINTKNACDPYNNVNTRPMSMNLKPNPIININNLDFEPQNAVDFKQMPNLDNIKYSGYKSYQTPLANLRNTPPLIYNSRPYTDSKLGLNYNYNPTNMYAPIANLAQPEMNYNNLDQSPTSLDLRQGTLNQPEINLNNVDQSPKSYDLTTDTTDIKDCLIKYINKNGITKQNDEITIPIGNIVLLDNTPIVNNVKDFKHSGLDLKMWQSNLKVVNAEVKLKCKEILFNNFMPIVMKDNVADYADVIKKYIEDKYGNCIVMNEPYSQENRHSVLNHFEPHTVGNQFNLLWPSHR